MKALAILLGVIALVTVALFALQGEPAVAGEVRSVSWPTKHAAPAIETDDSNRELLTLLRLGAASVPEALIMQFANQGGKALGLPEQEAESLQKQLGERYQKIANDPAFAKAPSMIAYCYSAQQPANGQAAFFVPEHTDENTPVILFLHGYGGSFQFYLHYFASAFPEHIVICPAYGITTFQVPGEYLSECIEATSKTLEHELATPTLIGLSAGGFGGFREYTRHPDRYLGFICLAAYPPEEVANQSPAEGRIRVLAGGAEKFVTNGSLAAAMTAITRRTKDTETQLLPDADHFFMLSEEKSTRKFLRKWIIELE